MSEDDMAPQSSLSEGDDQQVFDVFLSYCREDLDIMKRVHETLEEAELRVWYDKEGIKPGDPSWRRVIADAIAACGCFLAILTPKAKQSEWVEREIAYAVAQKKKLFYLLAAGDETNAIPIEAIPTQYTDIRSSADYEEALHELTSTIRKHLTQTRSSAQGIELRSSEPRSLEEAATPVADSQFLRGIAEATTPKADVSNIPEAEAQPKEGKIRLLRTLIVVIGVLALLTLAMLALQGRGDEATPTSESFATLTALRTQYAVTQTAEALTPPATASPAASPTVTATPTPSLSLTPTPGTIEALRIRLTQTEAASP